MRCDANLIVEPASASDPHHFGVLLGFVAGKAWPGWWITVPSRKMIVRIC
ncbi:MAG: hypothetical protein GPOALKHO_001614 [Sodalis sp.]|nr:MAG: hypothetical protein GPOALKHO_001614 [Sodalis sp.]